MEEDRVKLAELKKTYDFKVKSLRRKASADLIAESNKPRALWNLVNNERQERTIVHQPTNNLVQ